MEAGRRRVSLEDQRTAFTFHLKPRVVVAAFAEAVQQQQGIADWLEQAVVRQLGQTERGASHRELVAVFCDVAEREPGRLSPRLARVYAAIDAQWETYWIAPRATVGQLEEGLLSAGKQLPYLDRRRVAGNWSRLLTDAAIDANASSADTPVDLAPSTD